MHVSNKQLCTATNKARKRNTTDYATVGNTYTVLRNGLGLPQQSHINPKERNKEKKTSLVASWAGPLVPGESNLKSARTALVRHNEPLSPTQST